MNRTSASPSSVSERAIPEDLQAHLVANIDGLKDEPFQIQAGIAWFFWNGQSKWRRHKHYQDCASFGYEELRRVFGRGVFTRLNQAYGICEVFPASLADGYTFGYRLTDASQSLLDRYLESRPQREVQLVACGKPIRKPPKAIATKDRKGVTVKKWFGSESLNRVRVDLGSMEKLLYELSSAERRAQTLMVSADPDLRIALAKLQHLKRFAAMAIRMSMTTAAGLGYMIHQYIQSTSGRIYAGGINLQSGPTAVRQSALAGATDYDISNCHFSILSQMSRNHGHPCHGIEAYMASKTATRELIAREVGITVEQVKECLIALLYGARRSARPGNAIPAAIGGPRAERLFACASVSAIAGDISRARAVILDNCARNRQGNIVNSFGCSIAPSTPAKSLAHLVQGVEATALRAAVREYGPDMLLLQHDGFTARADLDCRAIEEVISNETGYALQVESMPVKFDLREQLTKVGFPELWKQFSVAEQDLRSGSRITLPANTLQSPARAPANPCRESPGKERYLKVPRPAGANFGGHAEGLGGQPQLQPERVH